MVGSSTYQRWHTFQYLHVDKSVESLYVEIKIRKKDSLSDVYTTHIKVLF